MSYILNEKSVNKLVTNFPKIRYDALKIIEEQIDQQLSLQSRLPGMKKEHLGTLGFCAEFSRLALKLIDKFYDVKLVQGFFRLDKHPRQKPNEKNSKYAYLAYCRW